MLQVRSRGRLRIPQIAMTIKKSNNTGKVTGFQVEDLQYTVMGKIILYRLLNDRDVKILITSSGNTTGTGKTTLAIILSRIIQEYCKKIFEHNLSWNAEKFAFMDVWEYLRKYEEFSGCVLITDELEYLADKRRSNSHENVFFSQAWQMLRYKNNITIGTAPSKANLDNRVPENVDIWINVVYQGLARTYYVKMHDFTEQIMTKRLKMGGFEEYLKWDAIDKDTDYRTLTQEKSEQGVPGLNTESALSEQDIKEAKKDTKKETALQMLKWKHEGIIDKNVWGQEKIGNLVGMSQQWVSNLKKRETDY